MAMRKLRALAAGGGVAIKQGFGDGAAAGSGITITGIKVGDEIISAFIIQPPGASSGKTFKADVTAETTISAADTVKCSTTASSGTNEQLLVTWATIK